MLDFETSNSKLEVSKSNSWKITSFSITTSLQREPFLTMFYTINLSPLLVSKLVLMLRNILNNYQKCPVPLKPLSSGIWKHTVVHQGFLFLSIFSCNFTRFIFKYKVFWARLFYNKVYRIVKSTILTSCRAYMISKYNFSSV